MRLNSFLLIEKYLENYYGFKLLKNSSNYFKKNGIVDLYNNWKLLDDAKQNDWILLFHATDLNYALNIMDNGFGEGKKNFKESISKYTYLGEREGLNEYLKPHKTPVIMFVKVRKRNLLPDMEYDWKNYLNNKTTKKIIKNFNILKTKLTATDTLMTINQVKAENRFVIPLGLYNQNNSQFYLGD